MGNITGSITGNYQ